MPELRIEARQLFEMFFRCVDVAGFVRRFADQIVRIANLTFLACELESLLAVAARFIEIVKIEVTIGEIAVRIRFRMRSGDLVDDAVNEAKAFFAVAGEQRTVAEVRDDGY